MEPFRKFLSGLLVLAMLLTYVPVPGFAQEETPAEVVEATDEVPASDAAPEDPAEEPSQEEPAEDPLPEDEGEPEQSTSDAPEEEEVTDADVPGEETVVEEAPDAPAPGAEPEEDTEVFGGTLVYEKEPLIIGGEELTDEAQFAGYTERLFYGMEDVSPFSFGSESAGARLTGDAAEVYSILLPLFQAMAKGTITSLSVDLHPGSAETPMTFTETPDEYDFWAAFKALEYDYPYDTYWYDTASCSYYTDRTTGRVSRVLYSCVVMEEYRGSDEYTLNTQKISAVHDAADNVQSIIDQYDGCTDYVKLCGYRDAICSMVDYDDDAADYGPDVVGWTPWGVINTFDNDPNTKVVCGGYAKSFQLLCDRGGIQCYYILGCPYENSEEEYIPGGHAWNIVTLNDTNYHCDITWVDGEGTYWDYLFLAGGSGSPYDDYTFVGPQGQQITYRYDIEQASSDVYNMLLVWGEDVLTLSPTSYSSSTASCDHNYSGTITKNPTATSLGVPTT